MSSMDNRTISKEILMELWEVRMMSRVISTMSKDPITKLSGIVTK